METYQFEDLFEYGIIWSNRKTLTIAIEVGGKVVVKAPSFLTKKEIEYYLVKKRDWILNHLPQMVALEEKKNIRKYEAGEKFLFRGVEYLLEIRRDVSYTTPVVKLLPGKLHISGKQLTSDEIQNALKEWYVKQAVQIVQRRVGFYAPLLNVVPNKISLRDTKSRWGSCSSRGNIMINWRVIMAPPEILDYVVVHELCHLKEMNHSRKFWKLVETIIPDWKGCREWLRSNGISLSV